MVWLFKLHSALMEKLLIVPVASCVESAALSKRSCGFVGRKCWMYKGVRVLPVLVLTMLRNLDHLKSITRCRPVGVEKCWVGLVGSWEEFAWVSWSRGWVEVWGSWEVAIVVGEGCGGWVVVCVGA
jgi:hypothetical protein